MSQRRKGSILPTAASVLAGLFLIFGGPVDYATRLLNFSTLTKAEIESKARAYVEKRTDGKQAACLYVVSCDGKTARLALVPSLAEWDIAASKHDIWNRRTSGFCPGRTTNIGLQLIPENGGEQQMESLALARWSFFNDRFIPRSGRFQSGSFSHEEWEPCTFERALIRTSGTF